MRSSRRGGTTARLSRSSCPASTWRRRGSDGWSRRSPSGSERTTCIRMCDRRCQLCVKPGCGLASPAIRRSVPLGALRALDLPADLIATSDDWGASKPDVALFEPVIKAAPAAPGEILYVGNGLDNDIVPAAQTGMLTALIRRGPRGVIQQHDPAAETVATMRRRLSCRAAGARRAVQRDGRELRLSSWSSESVTGSRFLRWKPKEVSAVGAAALRSQL
ncbi:hypothetical protein SBRY_30827 [Actinacidiphila bryophytorum]|uniref:HAD family hydrolase n=1 Tax=Actinacidiphila bryophytorum TaxID=1436133 RepID=A0A9W4H1R3_9ACTN|nr:hypothetical protein SBRY_30827 [Actinacidiphila bryophytorum]